MAALHSQIAQQKCRSLLRQPTGSTLQPFKRHLYIPPLPARSQQHVVPPPWQTCGSSSISAAATPAAVAYLPEPDRLGDQRLQRLCKNVLVGVAAAAAWSVAASAFCGGSTSPLASLTLATQPGASGMKRSWVDQHLHTVHAWLWVSEKEVHPNVPP